MVSHFRCAGTTGLYSRSSDTSVSIVLARRLFGAPRETSLSRCLSEVLTRTLIDRGGRRESGLQTVFLQDGTQLSQQRRSTSLERRTRKMNTNVGASFVRRRGKPNVTSLVAQVLPFLPGDILGQFFLACVAESIGLASRRQSGSRSFGILTLTSDRNR